MVLAILIGLLAHGGPSKPVVLGPRRTTSMAPVYRFVSRRHGAKVSFRCAFDRPRLHRCAARYRQRLAVGSHVLRVRAVDGRGRPSPLTQVVARVPVGDRPIGIGYDDVDASVWVANFGDSAVTKIDPTANAIRARAVVPGEHEDVVFGFGSVWVPSEEGWITRLDPATLTPRATISVAADPDFALVALGSVWTTAYQGSALSRIDPATNAVTASLPVRQGLQGLAFDGTSFWAANYDDSRLLKLDPGTGRTLASWSTDGGPRDVLIAFGSVWVANSRASTVLRLTQP